MPRSSTHPQVGVAGVAQLVGSLAGASLRRTGMTPALHRWLRAQAERGGGAVAAGALGRRVLLVEDRALSAEVLGSPPRTDRLGAGELRRRAMGFLAPRALTISDDDDWVRRRALNERVLDAGRPHGERQAYLEAAHAAFAAPARSVEELRAGMGRLMLSVVLGDGAPADLPDEVRALMGVVRSPARRLLGGRLHAARRARLFEEIRRRWERAPAHTLLGRFRDAGATPRPEALDQVPHWMFTFVLSGTDLLTRALAMIGSRPDALRAGARRDRGRRAPGGRRGDRRPRLRPGLHPRGGAALRPRRADVPLGRARPRAGRPPRPGRDPDRPLLPAHAAGRGARPDGRRLRPRAVARPGLGRGRALPQPVPERPAAVPGPRPDHVPLHGRHRDPGRAPRRARRGPRARLGSAAARVPGGEPALPPQANRPGW